MSAPTPAEVAAWPKPNYVDPVSLDAPVQAVNVVCITLMTLFVAGRFWSRIRIVKKPLAADDWMMLVAYILTFTLCVFHMVELKYGIGRHLYDVDPRYTVLLGKMTLVTQAGFAPLAALTKISICLTYLLLFPTAANQRFSYIMMGILVGYGVSSCLVVIFQCIPIEATWSGVNPGSGKKCINGTVFFVWLGAANAVTDLVVFLWPIRYLWIVKIRTSTRIALSACFGVGVGICIVALVRLWLVIHFFYEWDVTWFGAWVYLLISLELSFGVICGCLPSNRLLLLNLFATVRKSTLAGSSRKTGSKSTSNNQPTIGSGGKGGIKELKTSLASTDIELGTRDERWDGASLEPERRPRSPSMRQGSEDRIISSGSRVED